MKNTYDTHTVTELGPGGTLESYEVVVVPLHISVLVKIILGVRAVVTFWATSSLTVITWVVDLTDALTKKVVPEDLYIEDPHGKP